MSERRLEVTATDANGKPTSFKGNIFRDPQDLSGKEHVGMSETKPELGTCIRDPFYLHTETAGCQGWMPASRPASQPSEPLSRDDANILAANTFNDDELGRVGPLEQPSDGLRERIDKLAVSLGIMSLTKHRTDAIETFVQSELSPLRELVTKWRNGEGTEALRKIYNDTNDEGSGMVLDAVLMCAADLAAALDRMGK